MAVSEPGKEPMSTTKVSTLTLDLQDLKTGRNQLCCFFKHPLSLVFCDGMLS